MNHWVRESDESLSSMIHLMFTHWMCSMSMKDVRCDMCHSRTHCVIRMSRTQWLIPRSRTACAECRWKRRQLWYVSLINTLCHQNVTNSMIHRMVTHRMCSMSKKATSVVICVTHECTASSECHEPDELSQDHAPNVQHVVEGDVSCHMCHSRTHCVIRMSRTRWVISRSRTECAACRRRRRQLWSVSLMNDLCQLWYVSLMNALWLTNALRHQIVTNSMSHLRITNWMCTMSMRVMSAVICVTHKYVANICVPHPMKSPKCHELNVQHVNVTNTLCHQYMCYYPDICVTNMCVTNPMNHLKATHFSSWFIRLKLT